MKLLNALIMIMIVIIFIVTIAACIYDVVHDYIVANYMRNHYNVITIVIDEPGIGLDDLYVKYGNIEAGRIVFTEVFEDLNGTTSIVYGARYDVPCWP